MRVVVKKFISGFKEKRKTELYEKLMWGLESVIYIIMSFFAGFQFHLTKNILWFGLFLLILLIRFRWQQFKEVTRRAIL
jgi:hypothetical protein